MHNLESSKSTRSKASLSRISKNFKSTSSYVDHKYFKASKIYKKAPTQSFITTIKKEPSKIFTTYNEQRLSLQRYFGLITLIPFCGIIIFIFKFILAYKIENIKTIRRQFQAIIAKEDPLVICSNHLTFIDSCLILWALAPIYWYQFNYRFFSWNLPAGDFFGKKIYYRIIAFLSKCIFIHRDASSFHHNQILNICRRLLMRGEIVTIFPEGKRSRTGLFDKTKLTLGVGKMIKNIPRCRVLCIYIRANKQNTFSDYPAKNSSFDIKMTLIHPYSQKDGREAHSEIVQQIATSIGHLQDNYFEQRNKKCTS